MILLCLEIFIIIFSLRILLLHVLIHLDTTMFLKNSQRCLKCYKNVQRLLQSRGYLISRRSHFCTLQIWHKCFHKNTLENMYAFFMKLSVQIIFVLPTCFHNQKSPFVIKFNIPKTTRFFKECTNIKEHTFLLCLS